MTSILPYIEQQFFDNAGNPLVGGKIYSYVTGTSTPTPTYTDATGTTPNTNPIILDAFGRASIWLSGTTKFVIQDSTGATITTKDAIPDYSAQIASATSISSGAASTVQITSNDATFGRLSTKLINTASQGISATVINPAGDEKLSLAIDIPSMAADTTPDATADYIASYDMSGTSNKKVLFSDLFKSISTLPTDASPDPSADYIVTYDASATTSKKVLLGNAAGIINGTTQLTSSGSSVSFSGLPAGIRAIHICFMGVSSSTTSNYTITINGETSGYVGTVSIGSSTAAWSSSIQVTQQVTASATYSGVVTIRVADPANFTYAVNGSIASTAGPFVHASAGTKITAAILSSVTISCGGFNGGKINVQYELGS